jgi:hypothetical protein
VRAPACLPLLALVAASCGGDGRGDGGDNDERESGEPAPLKVSLSGDDLHPEGPPTVVHGGRVRLSGAVEGGVPGRREQLTVELLGRPDGATKWHRVAEQHPERHGIQFRTRPRRNKTLRASKRRLGSPD